MIQNVTDLIALWPEPKISTFAKDIGVTTEHGAAMKRRGSIPPSRWNQVVEAAAKRNIDGITIEALANLAAVRWNKPPKRAA